MKSGQIIKKLKLKNDDQVVIRFIMREDCPGHLRLWNGVIDENDFLNKDKPVSRKQEEEYLKKCLNGIKNKTCIALVAEINKKIVGSANFQKSKGRMSHVADFGIIIQDSLRGLGIGSALLSAMLQIARENGVKVARINLMGTNKRAFNTYKKLGFKKNGLLPKGIKRKGKYIDLVEMYKEL